MKQMNAVMLGLGWMVSLGLVFILGILSAFTLHLGPGSGDGLQGDLTLEQRELLLVIERYTGRPGNIAEIVAVGSGQDMPDQLEQTLRAIMRETDRWKRQIATTQLVDGLPSRRVMGSIKFIQEIPSDPGRDEVLGSFLESWAMADGRRAMAFATALDSPPERELAIRAVLSGWSKELPVEAWNWVVTTTGSSLRGGRWLEIIASNLGAADLATAFNLLERIPNADVQQQMGGIIMGQILQNESPREAIAWISEFPAAAIRPAAIELAVNWAVTEPREAAEWLSRAFPGEVTAMVGVIQEWVYVSPVVASDWVWSRYTGSGRRLMMDVISEEWIANEGPVPLAEWLNEHGPDSSLDGAINRLALATVEIDPVTALGWAQSVVDPDERSMLEIMIGRQWIRISPDTAAQRLPELLVSESARAALLEPEYYEVDDTGLIPEEIPFEFEEEPL